MKNIPEPTIVTQGHPGPPQVKTLTEVLHSPVVILIVGIVLGIIIGYLFIKLHIKKRA